MSIPSVSVPAFRLHDYTRDPKKRALAEALYVAQRGVCAKFDHADVGNCVEVLELHHRNGNPNDWAWTNLQLLCETHHRAETNRQRAEFRHSLPMVVRNRQTYPPESASLEDDKKEHYRPKFDRFCAEFFQLNPGIVSKKALAIRAIGQCSYTDSSGKLHKPSSATLMRYIEEENSELNQAGFLHFASTANDEPGVEYVGNRQA